MTQTAQQLRETEIKELIRRRLRHMAPLLRGHRVYLFGSRARGRAASRSDFDIGVLGDEPLPLRDFYAIEDALDELPTLYRIDWVDLNRTPPQFRERAMQAAEIMYE
jgi:predicted nucleotidyltransferase